MATTCTGILTDQGGKPLVGVNVYIINSVTGAIATTVTTNAYGVYSATGLAEGSYYGRAKYGAAGMVNYANPAGTDAPASNTGAGTNLAFTSTDYNTVSWAAASIVIGGTTYSIDAGNTGNITALTYIYLDTAVSTTVLQTTTTLATAVGATKTLFAVAQPDADTSGNASIIPYNGASGILIDGALSIAALSIVAGQIAANTITGAKVLSMDLTTKTLTADTGTVGGWTLAATTLTGGGVLLDSAGIIRANATAILTGDGFYYDYNAGTPRFRVGTISGGALAKGWYWDGANLIWKATNTSLDASGNLTASSATLSGAITATSGSITGAFTIGTGGSLASGATAILTGDGYWFDYNAGTPRSRVGTVSGGALTKGWCWDGADFYWIGANSSLTAAGLFTASNAVITGTINATAGYFGSLANGVSVDSTGLTLAGTGYFRTNSTAMEYGGTLGVKITSAGINIGPVSSSESAHIRWFDAANPPAEYAGIYSWITVAQNTALKVNILAGSTKISWIEHRANIGSAYVQTQTICDDGTPKRFQFAIKGDDGTNNITLGQFNWAGGAGVAASLSLGGGLYPGSTAGATQSTRYLYDTGSYSAFSAGLIVTGALGAGGVTPAYTGHFDSAAAATSLALDSNTGVDTGLYFLQDTTVKWKVYAKGASDTRELKFNDGSNDLLQLARTTGHLSTYGVIYPGYAGMQSSRDIRDDGSRIVVDGVAVAKRACYATTSTTLVLDGTGTQAWTTVTTTAVPAGATAIILFVMLNDTGTAGNAYIQFRPTGTTDGNLQSEFYNVVASQWITGLVMVELNSSRQFDYRVNQATSATWRARLMGWVGPASGTA